MKKGAKPNAEALPFFEPGWKEEWKGMPEYVQEVVEPYFTLNVKFKCQEDVDAFAKLMDQTINTSSKSGIWYPKLVQRSRKVAGYVDEE